VAAFRTHKSVIYCIDGAFFTFGAVLPLIIASPFVLISALLHLALYPLALRLFSRLRARG